MVTSMADDGPRKMMAMRSARIFDDVTQSNFQIGFKMGGRNTPARPKRTSTY
jgi:hypothetical protein